MCDSFFSIQASDVPHTGCRLEGTNEGISYNCDYADHGEPAVPQNIISKLTEKKKKLFGFDLKNDAQLGSLEIPARQSVTVIS